MNTIRIFLFTVLLFTMSAFALTITTTVCSSATEVRLTGPWWSWDVNGGPVATGPVATDNNDDGIWTFTMDAPTENMEYLLVVDGVQENLANTDRTCTRTGDDGKIYANRQWTVGSENVVNTYGTCGNCETEPTIALPVDFEETFSSDAYEIHGFGGGVPSLVYHDDGPVLVGLYSLKYVKGGGQNWAGVSLILDTAVDAANGKIITADVYSTEARIITLGLSGIDRAATHRGTGWESLYYDFTGHIPAEAPKIITFINEPGVDGEAGDDWTIYIDNIAQAENLVTDGTFDQPASSNTWYGNAYNPVESVNQADIAWTGTAGDPWDVNLSGYVDVTDGADYTLSFDVTGADRTIVAGIGQSVDPSVFHKDTVTVSAITQTIVMHLTAKADGTGEDFGGDTTRVFFDMGADTGAVSIDNVVLTAGHTGIVNLGTIAVNLGTIALPVNFEEPAEAYHFENFNGGVASLESAPYGEYGVSLKYVKGISIYAGVLIDLDTAVDAAYGTIITADVYSTEARTITLKFDNADVELVASHGGSGWKSLSYDFTSAMPPDQTKIAFFNSVEEPGDGSEYWTIYIDNLAQAFGPDSGEPPLTITTTVCDAATSVSMTGPWWGWVPDAGPVAVDNGDGTWTFTIDPAPTDNMEYLLVVDGVQEDLVAANTASEDWSCTPSTSTDYVSYAVRQWVVLSPDVVNTYGTCKTSGCAGTPEPTGGVNLVLTTDGAPVRLLGPLWGWDANGGPEASDNGDGTWTVTLDPAPTENMEYLWVVDGVHENLVDNAANTECSAEIDGGSLITDYANYANRVLVHDSGNVADTYDACAGTTGPKDVTFSVDMTGVDLTDGIPTLQSTFNDWCGNCNPMSDDDGDKIWTVTVNIPQGDHEYKYALGAWVSQESVPADCDNTLGANRAVTVTGDVTLATDVYNGCPVGDTGGGTQLKITTTVCSSAIEVRLTGPWWDWDPNGGPVAADNGDGTWTFTFIPAPTENMEYLLLVNGVQENLANTDRTCTRTGDDGSTYAPYRQWTVGSGNVVNTYGTCGNCETEPTIALPVDFEEAFSADAYEIDGFDGGVASLESAPYGLYGVSLKYVKDVPLIAGQSQDWAGAQGVSLILDTAVDVANGEIITADVYSTVARVIALGLGADKAAPLLHFARGASHTGSGWESLSYDFTGAMPAEQTRIVFTRIVFINDLSQQGDGSEEWTIYIDNIAQASALSDTPDPPARIDRPNLVSKWHLQIECIDGLQNCWANEEQQHYTDRLENAYVSDGHLHIVAKKEEEEYESQGVKRAYTSARLNSKHDFKYGTVKVRAKLPKKSGLWPAIWTLGSNINEVGVYDFGRSPEVPWRNAGEIDIMEQYGTQNFVGSAMHGPSDDVIELAAGDAIPWKTQELSTSVDDFHVYSMEWTETTITFKVDDVAYKTVTAPTDKTNWPFDHKHFLLLNVAVEPVRSGSIQSDFVSGEMVVDYVRIYGETGDLNWSDEFGGVSASDCPGLKEAFQANCECR